MISYDRLLVKERSVVLGGRGFSLRPLRFPRAGHSYRVRQLSVRGFLDLWTGVHAILPATRPDGVLDAIRKEFVFILTASPRLITAERVTPRDLMDMTQEQALLALAAFEQINDLEFLFKHFSAPEPPAPKRHSRRPAPPKDEKRVGIVVAIAAFMRAFPAYDLPKVMEMPAPAFFALLEALPGGDGGKEADGRWKSLSPEERQALQDRIMKRAQERKNV